MLEVLMSCMHRTDNSIVAESGLSARTLVINQCDTDEERMTEEGVVRRLDTPTRGLSVSRNLAMEKAVGDICLFADDDERFLDGLEEKIETAYAEQPDADIIVFRIKDRRTSIPKSPSACVRWTFCGSARYRSLSAAHRSRERHFLTRNSAREAATAAGRRTVFFSTATKPG